MGKGRAALWVAAALVVWGAAAFVALGFRGHGGNDTIAPIPAPAGATPASSTNALPRSGHLAPTVSIDLRRPPKAGLLFDLHTGQVLWQVGSDAKLPIASLTKMMTGLIIAERHKPGERVPVTRQALAFQGSGMGVLPKGKKVSVQSLLDGLLLVSANDAAIALAQYDAGSVGKFVQRMNKRAAQMGLHCTHFSTPNGLRDKGNHSCARDLATLARADLANPRIRRIVKMKSAHVRFPIQGGYLDLNNINPLIGEPGITGLKTGLTDAAGRCYVTTAKQGKKALGIVLLHSPQPLGQIHRLLRAGWQALNA